MWRECRRCSEMRDCKHTKLSLSSQALVCFCAVCLCVYRFNSDLSSWCVEKIATEPGIFDDGADAWMLSRPNWGVPC